MLLRPQVIRVTEQIYCVRSPSYLSCSYLILRKSDVVLIDAGMRSDGGDMLFALELLGRNAGEVSTILLTHWHNDHAAGAQALRKLSNARVYYHPADSSGYLNDPPVARWRSVLSSRLPEWGPFILAIGIMGMAVPRPVSADGEVRDGELIADDFLAVTTPGHTPGHTSYFYLPEKALFAGDALAVIDQQIRFMAKPVTPDISSAFTAMKKCLELEFSLLCPGHRQFLVEGAEQERLKMKKRLTQSSHWPFFG